MTAVSVHACAYIPGYTILRSGGSFGLGYGPIVTAMDGTGLDGLRGAKIAIPGRMTSAFLLLQLAIGEFEYVETEFSRVPEAVRSGRADAGLVIHETQLSYKDEGLTKVADSRQVVGRGHGRAAGAARGQRDAHGHRDRDYCEI